MTPANATETTEPASKQSLRLWLKLLKLQRSIEAHIRDKLRREFNTTLPRFDLMSALHRHPDGLKMSELSHQLMVSNGNVTGITNRLVEEGFVRRINVPGDRRASRVQLTAEGEHRFLRQAAAHERWVHDALGSLSLQDSALLITQLQPSHEPDSKHTL